MYFVSIGIDTTTIVASGKINWWIHLSKSMSLNKNITDISYFKGRYDIVEILYTSNRNKTLQTVIYQCEESILDRTLP